MTARQSRLPIMYAAIPITSWGLAMAAVNPSANPAAPGRVAAPEGVRARQSEYGNAVPLTLEEEQPRAEPGQRNEHDRKARQSSAAMRARAQHG